MKDSLPKRSLKELLSWLVGKRMRYVVAGSSLTPEIHEGMQILVKPHDRKSVPKKDTIVILEHPFKKTLLIKRVKEVLPNGEVFVVGNAEESTDSRSFGPVPVTSIRGCVTSVLAEK